MWVPIVTWRFIHIAIVWQPMPADTTLPSIALVELLCGHPEQYQAVRTVVSSLLRLAISSSRFNQSSADSTLALRDRRFTRARLMCSDSNSP